MMARLVTLGLEPDVIPDAIRGSGDQHEPQTGCKCGCERVSTGPLGPALDPRHWSGPNGHSVQESAQVVGQLARGRIPPGRVFLQALQTDCLQVARDSRLQSSWRDRVQSADLLQSVEHSRAAERRATREELVKN